MAEAKKKNKNKSNSKKNSSTVTKKNNNKKNTTKKTNTKTTNKKNNSNKKATTKVNQTNKKLEVKEEKKIETQIVEEKVNKNKKDTTNKKEKNKEVKKTGNKKDFKQFFNINPKLKKFKSLKFATKCLIIVSFICGLLLIVEGILVLQHKGYIDRHTVYHETYNGVGLDDKYVLVAGSTDIKHGTLGNTKGNERGKLVKYDNQGDTIFEKVYERGISTTFTSVTPVSDGYIVTGTGIFSEEEKDNEGREAIIIKYTRDGDIVWEKFYQVITDTKFNKAIQVSDGYVVIGQSIYANMEMGNHTTGGGIIVKYDFDGNEVWHNNHGGTKSGNFNDIVEVNGDFYVVGKDGADSANLVKFNSKGVYQWHKNYSYTDKVGFSGIAYENDSLYVVGSKKVLPEGTGDEDDRTTTNTDALLVNYDLNGNVLFEKTFGGSSYERYNNIIAYHNNFYVVGHICSKDAGLKITNDQDDEMTGFVVRYDINGNILKKEVLGGSNNDNLVDIITDGISYYVVGYSNSKDGNIRGSHSNGKDYYGKLIKLNSKFKKIFVK